MNYDHLSDVYEDYLEHYGVKGMKWGVRKEEETSSMMRSQRPTSKLRASIAKGDSDIDVTGYISGNKARASYLIIEELAKTKVENRLQAIRKADSILGTTAYQSLTNDQVDSMFNDAYNSVLSELDLSEDQTVALIGYGLLEQYGLSSYFDIVLGSKNGKKVVVYLDKDTFEPFYSIDECSAHVRAKTGKIGILGGRSRSKNVTGNAVRVKKGRRVSSSPSLPDGSANISAMKTNAKQKKTLDAGRKIIDTALKDAFKKKKP